MHILVDHQVAESRMCTSALRVVVPSKTKRGLLRNILVDSTKIQYFVSSNVCLLI